MRTVTRHPARHMVVRERKVGFSVVNIVLRPLVRFIWAYFFRGGFLDGREGSPALMNHAAYGELEVCQGVGEEGRLPGSPDLPKIEKRASMTRQKIGIWMVKTAYSCVGVYRGVTPPPPQAHQHLDPALLCSIRRALASRRWRVRWAGWASCWRSFLCGAGNACRFGLHWSFL